MPAQTPVATPAPAAGAPAAAAKGTAPAAPTQAQPTNGKAPEGPKRGFVVYVDTTRIVIDLTAADGIRPGTLVSLRRADVIPLVHPVTGEVLGNLDEEIGTARVTEMRERFSVADVQTVAPGARIQVKDRVVPK
jgi:hypothetical protein